MKRFLMPLVCLFLGCGEGGTASDPVPSDAGADDAGSHEDAAMTRCVGKPAAARDSVVELTFGGATRTARLHVPPGYDPATPTPLVLDFHGSSSNGMQQSLFSKLDGKADEAGFIAVHPDGLDGAWNAGTCCDPAVMNDVDDVGFVAALLDRLEAELCLDPARVYATGMSNGAELAHRLACDLTDRVAAIAAVSGGDLTTVCKPSRPIAVLSIHGDADDMVPIDGDEAHPPIAETVASWVSRNACTGEPRRTFDQGDAYCDSYESCADGTEVESCVVRGGGHNWPGGLDVGFLGHVSKDLNANDAMWTFFQKHPRDEALPSER